MSELPDHEKDRVKCSNFLRDFITHVPYAGESRKYMEQLVCDIFKISLMKYLKLKSKRYLTVREKFCELRLMISCR